MRDASTVIEGRNAVLEALRSGKPVDRVFILAKSYDAPFEPLSERPKRGTVSLALWIKSDWMRFRRQASIRG